MENTEVGLMNSISSIKKNKAYEKMEALLEKIVKNTEPKISFQIVVSNDKTKFKTRFNPPIQLDKIKGMK